MSTAFDAYHKWLGIPPEDQPPNHYRLLGIHEFETDADVIANAADQRMAHLRSFQTSSHAGLSEKLLNEVAAARVYLLDTEKKAQYDMHLRARLGQNDDVRQPPQPPPVAPPKVDGPASRNVPSLARNNSEDSGLNRFFQQVEYGTTHHPAPVHGPKFPNERRLFPTILATAGGVAALAVIVGLLFAFIPGPDDKLPPNCAEDDATAELQLLEDPNAEELPETSRLILRWPETEREGAVWKIDGYRRVPSDSSPAHLEFELEPGKHHVQITRDGYVPFDEKVTLRAGNKTDKAVTWEPVVKTDGTGLWAEYFNGRECEDLKLKRVDRKVHFVWGTDSPDERVPADNFSVRWTGYLKAPFAGRYKLRAVCDDVVRVWLDGKEVLSGEWFDRRRPEAEVELNGRPQRLKIEYCDHGGDAVVCLNWLPPGDFVEHAIPPAAFFHDEQVAKAAHVDRSILRASPGENPPALVAGHPVNLLPLIDPAKHTVRGKWWFDGEALVCGADGPAGIQIPVSPTGAHLIRAEIERQTGGCEFVLSSAVQGRPLSLVLDAWGRISGVELIDGNRVDRNETRRTRKIFTNGQPRTITYSIGQERLAVTVDSETIIDWKPSFSRCSMCRHWLVPNPRQLSLCTWDGRFRISKLELIPIKRPTESTPTSTPRLPELVDTTPSLPSRDGDRVTIPDAKVQSRILRTLREELKDFYAQEEPFTQLALAARFIRRSRTKDESPDKRYVMLAEGARIAAEHGNAFLALAAVDEMATQFRIDHLKRKADILTLVARKARDATYVHTAAVSATELARELISPTTYDALSAAFRELNRNALRVCGPEVAKAIRREDQKVAEMRDLARTWSAARMRLQEFPEDPEACLDSGFYHCLARENWEEGMKYLAKSANKELAQTAVRLLEQPEDDRAQTAFGDAWWELAKKQHRVAAAQVFYLQAARHWYRKALPNLDGDRLVQVRQRLVSDEPFPDLPFRLDVNGLGGRAFLLPTKVSGQMKLQMEPQRGFGLFGNKCRLEYDRLPISSYIHEFEITFDTPGGSLEIAYGEPHDGVKICFWWEKEKKTFVCRVYHYRGCVVWWAGEKHYAPKTRLKFSFFVNEDSYRLYLEGRPQLGSGVRPMDLRFRISTGSDTMLLLSSSTFRPWTERDAILLRTKLPPTNVQCDWRETAVRLHDANFGLLNHPELGDSSPFVIPSTGTAMEWIAPGTFRRTWSEDGKKKTKVRIARGFWIGRCEISRIEWARVMGSTAGVCRVDGSAFLPIDGVSWDQAGAFCEALTRLERAQRRLPEGYVYRLPTEAEWEYACRAGSTEDFSVEPQEFWSSETSGWQPHEVAARTANAWNLYDMHGNVSEWCLDNWIDAPEIPPASVDDPVTLPKDIKGDDVLRGGAW